MCEVAVLEVTIAQNLIAKSLRERESERAREREREREGRMGVINMGAFRLFAEFLGETTRLVISEGP